MSFLDLSGSDYTCTVTVTRPGGDFDESGDFSDESTVIVSDMTADIQQSLQIRNHLSEDRSGTSDSTAWIMFCVPPITLSSGDLVDDGDRTFVIDAVGDWGTHVECVMRIA